MSSINRMASLSLESCIIPQSDPLEILTAHGASKEEYLQNVLKKALLEIPIAERMTVALCAAPLFETIYHGRDYDNILESVWKVPEGERKLLVEQTKRLLKSGDKPLIFVVLEALHSAKFDERDDLIRHVQAFVSNHPIGQFEISDAIYDIIKVQPKNRLCLIDNVTSLTCHIKSGVYRCAVLRELNEVALEDQYDVVKHVLLLIDTIGPIEDREYGNLVRAVAQIPAELRYDVIESAKPLLSGLDNYYVANLFMAIAQMDQSERDSTIQQLLPLVQLTKSGFNRGQVLLGISQLTVDQRRLVIDKAIPFLREDIWWCNSVDNFIRIAAATPIDELNELHVQVKSFLVGQSGCTVKVLMSCARAPRIERQALLDDVKSLVVGQVDLPELAAILAEVIPMQRHERQQLIRDTLRVLCQNCFDGRLQLFQAVRAIPVQFRERCLANNENCNPWSSNHKNSRIAEDLLNDYERLSGESYHITESLVVALQSWVTETNDFTYKIPKLEFHDAEASVLSFLGKLKTTEEYKNPTTRPFLAKRVLQIFTVMQEDNEIRQLATAIISIGLESCADRVITALDQIELQVRLYAIKKMDVDQQQIALKKLSEGFLLLAMIQEKIQQLLLEFPRLDEIGLHLTLQIRLAKCCELPVSTTTMLFSNCVGVPVAKIDAAVRQIVEGGTEARKAHFLSSWQPWMEFTREHAAVPVYENLPELLMPFSDAVCAISKEPTSQPVYYNNTLYDYDQFIMLYRKVGKDPMNQDSASNAINLQLLRRVVWITQ